MLWWRETKELGASFSRGCSQDGLRMLELSQKEQL